MCRLERRFENGCVFKFEIQPNEELTKMQLKDSKNKMAQWEVISNQQHKADTFFITEKRNGFLYVKVENLKSCSTKDFTISLKDDSKRNDFRTVDLCAVPITGMS